MADDGFDTDFVWYEWSFVSPEQVPTDDLQVPVAADSSPETARAWEYADEERPWMT